MTELSLERAAVLLRSKEEEVHRGADRLFFWLLLLQWVFAVTFAMRTDELPRAVLLGGLVTLLPIGAILALPGRPATRAAVALAQVGWSALLGQVTQGQLETEHHVFVSLAFLAFYRDWRVMVLALAAVLLGTVALGGALGERHLWMLLEGVLLGDGCVRGSRELREMAQREASLQRLSETVEQKVQEQTREIATSRERYRALVEGSHAVPWELDPRSLQFTYLSPQAAQLTGLDPQTPQVARALWKLVHPDDRDHVRRSLVELATAEDPGTLDFECRMNVREQLFIVRSRVSQQDGRLLGTSFDVTRHKTLELELRQAQKLESVGRLAAGVAHEINTPVQFVSDSVHFVRDSLPDLVGLLGTYRQLVPADSLPRAIAAEERADLPYLLEQMPKALDRSIDGLGRVSNIVKSMGAFARSDQLSRAPTDLNRSIEQTLVIARNEYKYVADVELDLQPLPLVPCHEGELDQVILNLVVNAAHAIAHKGEARGKITVRSRQEGDEVVIAVTDTGTGIAREIRDRIFEPFFTTKPVGQGTGQGLAIARSVVTERHGGQLDFTTRVGLGTTFTLRLPLAQRAAA
jgi:PAS domain S-box-containing protein